MRLSIVAAFAVFSVFGAFNAMAHDDDDTNDLEIEIRGPVDAVDVAGKTITVLGLTISVPDLVFSAASTTSAHSTRHDEGDEGGTSVGSVNGGNGGGGDDNDDDQGEDHEGDDGDDGDDGDGEHHGDGDNPPTITDLSSIQVGQFVRIKLASDTAPLTAVELKVEGAYANAVTIHAPIQAVDTTNKTVTVLDLTVDVSTAAFGGCDDANSTTTPTTIDTLAIGQNAELVLDASKLPALAALRVEVRNFTNQVDVEVDDKHGHKMGNDDGDVDVDVVQMVKVKDAKGRAHRQAVAVHTTTHTGNVTVSGLSPGRARVTVTHNGKSSRKTVTVGPNSMANLRLKLKSK
jgi:hypothetical protein